MKRMLITIRDSCYLVQRRNHSVAYADQFHKISLAVLLYPYYLTVALSITLLEHKAGLNRLIYPGSDFSSLLNALFLNSVYFFGIRFMHKQLDRIPIDAHNEPELYPGRVKRLILVTGFGLLQMYPVLWGLDRLIPEF